MKSWYLFAVLPALLIAGCATKTDVVNFDLANRAGLYVLAYVADEEARQAVENQLVTDIRQHGMVAFASHEDLPELSQTNAAQLVQAANAQKALAVLAVNQIAKPDNYQAINLDTLSAAHPDLESFYRYAQALDIGAPGGSEVWGEVSAFLLDGTSTMLVWSGTTWSFHADGEGTATAEMSEKIATELGEVRAALTAP